MYREVAGHLLLWCCSTANFIAGRSCECLFFPVYRNVTEVQLWCPPHATLGMVVLIFTMSVVRIKVSLVLKPSVCESCFTHKSWGPLVIKTVPKPHPLGTELWGSILISWVTPRYRGCDQRDLCEHNYLNSRHDTVCFEDGWLWTYIERERL